MYKKFTKETITELLEKKLLKPNKYLVTSHYLVVIGDKAAEKVYNYLFENNYTSTMENAYYNGAVEYGAIEVNFKGE